MNREAYRRLWNGKSKRLKRKEDEKECNYGKYTKTADPARSAVFLCVYEREKHTSIIK